MFPISVILECGVEQKTRTSGADKQYEAILWHVALLSDEVKRMTHMHVAMSYPALYWHAGCVSHKSLRSFPFLISLCLNQHSALIYKPFPLIKTIFKSKWGVYTMCRALW